MASTLSPALQARREIEWRQLFPAVRVADFLAVDRHGHAIVSGGEQRGAAHLRPGRKRHELAKIAFSCRSILRRIAFGKPNPRTTLHLGDCLRIVANPLGLPVGRFQQTHTPARRRTPRQMPCRLCPRLAPSKNIRRQPRAVCPRRQSGFVRTKPLCRSPKDRLGRVATFQRTKRQESGRPSAVPRAQRIPAPSSGAVRRRPPRPDCAGIRSGDRWHSCGRGCSPPPAEAGA